MAKKHKHPEHLNAEAWAIPYGDLVTLLLALFVVMYAMSSVNEGKYRVMSESMNEAFHGTPRTFKPVQAGDKNVRGMGSDARIALTQQPPKQVSIAGLHRDLKNPQVVQGIERSALPSPQLMPAGASGYRDGGKQALTRIAREVEQAMQGLIAENLIVVRRKATFLEIEIKTDLLFASGVADVAGSTRPVLVKLGEILKPFSNPLRVEGHTDNRPIATASYPSNWELSSARAASVVHVLLTTGVVPGRLSIAGFGEYQPVADNNLVEGRNANRRVVLVVLADESGAGPSLESLADAGSLVDEPAGDAETPPEPPGPAQAAVVAAMAPLAVESLSGESAVARLAP